MTGAASARASSSSWGDDIRMYRLRMTWAVGYAYKRDELLASRGISAE